MNQTQTPDLAARAQRLWPDQPNLQKQWLRAVEMVRKTKEGWLLDRRVRRTS